MRYGVEIVPGSVVDVRRDESHWLVPPEERAENEVFGSFLGALRNAAEDIVADSTLRTPDEDAAVEAAHHALVDAIADGDTGAAVVATRRNVHATLVRLRGEP